LPRRILPAKTGTLSPAGQLLEERAGLSSPTTFPTAPEATAIIPLAATQVQTAPSCLAAIWLITQALPTAGRRASPPILCSLITPLMERSSPDLPRGKLGFPLLRRWDRRPTVHPSS